MTDESLKQKAQKAASEAKASAPSAPPRPVTPRPRSLTVLDRGAEDSKSHT
ncbi:MAG: hypothetical protein AB1631_20525 [Acidobacteriota bacterium]